MAYRGGWERQRLSIPIGTGELRALAIGEIEKCWGREGKETLEEQKKTKRWTYDLLEGGVCGRKKSHRFIETEKKEVLTRINGWALAGRIGAGG